MSPPQVNVRTLVWSHEWLMWVPSSSVCLWGQWSCFPSVLSDLRLLLSSCPLSMVVPSLQGKDVYGCAICEHTDIFPTLRAGRVSALTAIYCTLKPLWWSLRAALIYGYRMYPEGSLLLHPFSEIIAVDSLMGPLNPPLQSWVLG